MTVAAMSATLAGVGLGRFAYAPLVPVLVAAGVATPGEAAYVGAANLAGYLAGALAARRLTRVRFPALMRVMMLLAAASFIGCAWVPGAPYTFAWLMAWRFVGGVAGAVLLVLASATVLPHVPPHRRGLAGGVIFLGVGLGAAISAVLVPLLLARGLAWTWIGLGALGLALAAAAWGSWPAGRAAGPARTAAAPFDRRVPALYATYGLNAAAFVPAMLFLVDYVARGLGRGLEEGAACWVAFGVGGIAGPVAAGWIGDRLGFRTTLRLGLATEAALMTCIPLLDSHPALLLASAGCGAFVAGIVPVVLSRLNELVPPESRTAAWSLATTGFALGQATGGYGLSAVFAATGSYALLFWIAGGLMAAGLAVELTASLGRTASP